MVLAVAGLAQLAEPRRTIEQQRHKTPEQLKAQDQIQQRARARLGSP
jgi:hypothetical protein